MDFVVAGLGLGALIVVVGFVVRDLGPLLWRFLNKRATSDDESARGNWVGLCHSISMIMTVAGATILIATIIAVALGLSDDLAGRIVLLVSLVAILGSALLLALNIRDYRNEVSLQTPMLSGAGNTGGRGLSTSLSTAVTSNTLTSVRPARKMAAQGAEAAVTSAVGPELPVHDPHLDEPFEATRLLATEFDGHLYTPAAGIGVAPESPDKTSPEPTTVAAGESELSGEIPGISDDDMVAAGLISEPTPVTVEPGPIQTVAVQTEGDDDPAISPVFRSPLLADISVAGDGAAGGFESSLLADVDSTDDEHGEQFVSPLFANLSLDGDRALGNGLSDTSKEQKDEDDSIETAAELPVTQKR